MFFGKIVDKIFGKNIPYMNGGIGQALPLHIICAQSPSTKTSFSSIFLLQRGHGFSTTKAHFRKAFHALYDINYIAQAYRVLVAPGGQKSRCECESCFFFEFLEKISGIFIN